MAPPSSPSLLPSSSPPRLGRPALSTAPLADVRSHSSPRADALPLPSSVSSRVWFSPSSSPLPMLGSRFWALVSDEEDALSLASSPCGVVPCSGGWGWPAPLLASASSLLGAGAGRWWCLRRSTAGSGSRGVGVNLVSLRSHLLLLVSWVVLLMGSLEAPHLHLPLPLLLRLWLLWLRRRWRRRQGRRLPRVP